MRYRSRADIVAKILILAKDGTSKTKIMYGACLSYTQINEYLTLLINNGLLEQKGKTYHATKKGIDFLKHYEAIGIMFDVSDSKKDEP